MKDEDRTKELLISELVELRQRVAELGASETGRKQAEEALAQERNLLRALIDNVPDLIYAKDVESRFTLVNIATAQSLGSTLEGVLGKSDFDFHPRELAERYYADEREIISSGRPMIAHEEPCADPAGNVRWYSTTKTPLRDSQGQIVGLVGVNRDVTERRQAEEALHQKLADQAALYQASQVFLGQVNVATTLEDACRLAVERFGLRMAWAGLVSEDDFDVHPFSACGFEEGYLDSVRITWDDGPSGQGPTGTAIRTAQAVAVNQIEAEPSYAPWRSAATERGYRSSAALPLCYGDEVLGVLNVYSAEPGYFTDDRLQVLQSFANLVAVALEKARLYECVQSHAAELEQRVAERTAELTRANEQLLREIAERRRAEEALRTSEARYRTLAENFPNGAVIMFDRDLRYIVADGAGLAEGGLAKELLEGKTVREALPPEVCAIVEPHYRAALAGQTNVFEMPYANRVYESCVLPIRDEGGEVMAGMVMTQDITERKQVEGQLRQAQKMEAVGTLAGGIAHEFNNLLTGIIGNLSLALVEVEPGSQVYQDLQGVERSARRAAALTQQLLAFSRKSRSERLRPVNLNRVVKEVTDLLRQTIDRRVEMNTYPAADLWPVEADPNQMHQVLINLCLNARDAIMEVLQEKGARPEKRPDEPLAITVETENVTLDEEYCRVHLEAQPGQFMCLTVSDNGSGMDAETQARVFEPFFTTKEMGQGTGLGLSLVFGIVKGHGGFINLYSEPGEGTTFRVYLPRAGEQTATEAETEAEPAAPPTGSETVLLVDDDEAVRNAGRRILESLGYTVLLAGDGQEALQVYGRERAHIDLVLLDLVMPRLSGQETLRGILQFDSGAKVILASGYSANGPGSAALAEGAAAFVQKPYDLHELAQAVRDVLDG